MLRFVEVKLRGETVDLDEVVTASKRLRLRGAARAWMRERNEAWGDIAFLIAFVDNEGHVEWTDDAF
jgi:Holliday junction resolvase-like predicted endonuclease